MTKAETLIKYLPCHTTCGDFELCAECPYNPHPGKIWEFGCAHGQDKMIDEAIAMLKEQEVKTGHWILDPDGMDLNIPAWRCSECGNRHYGLPIANDIDEANIYLFAGSRFCPNCGEKMSRE